MKQQGREVHEYYPKEVKKAITGNGNASKEQVAFMLGKMVKLPNEKLSNDATDALGYGRRVWHPLTLRPRGDKNTERGCFGSWSCYFLFNGAHSGTGVTTVPSCM